MAVYYLKHPVHGAKVATSEQEVIYDAMSGWVQYDPATPAAAEPDDAVVNEMAEPKRRGRLRANLEG